MSEICAIVSFMVLISEVGLIIRYPNKANLTLHNCKRFAAEKLKVTCSPVLAIAFLFQNTCCNTVTSAIEIIRKPCFILFLLFRRTPLTNAGQS